MNFHTITVKVVAKMPETRSRGATCNKRIPRSEFKTGYLRDAIVQWFRYWDTPITSTMDGQITSVLNQMMQANSGNWVIELIEDRPLYVKKFGGEYLVSTYRLT